MNVFEDDNMFTAIRDLHELRYSYSMFANLVDTENRVLIEYQSPSLSELEVGYVFPRTEALPGLRTTIHNAAHFSLRRHKDIVVYFDKFDVVLFDRSYVPVELFRLIGQNTSLLSHILLYGVCNLITPALYAYLVNHQKLFQDWATFRSKKWKLLKHETERG